MSLNNLYTVNSPFILTTNDISPASVVLLKADHMLRFVFRYHQTAIQILVMYDLRFSQR